MLWPNILVISFALIVPWEEDQLVEFKISEGMNENVVRDYSEMGIKGAVS